MAWLSISTAYLCWRYSTQMPSKSESCSLSLIGICSPANNSKMPKPREIVHNDRKDDLFVGMWTRLNWLRWPIDGIRWSLCVCGTGTTIQWNSADRTFHVMRCIRNAHTTKKFNDYFHCFYIISNSVWAEWEKMWEKETR